ncbi:uncharacterized protein [Palaemon carinicauda]|uniref:uncharacterized protein n=1 Tax=Palaemon carinicauda TaxID=392227 RepID=UPI0035B5E990
MNKMKVALVILMTMTSLAVLQELIDSDNELGNLGKLIYHERANIFAGKIMPLEYVKIEKEVEKPCQCRHLCLATNNCWGATWLGMLNNSISFCLIAQEYFSHLELRDPTPEDYANYFKLASQTTNGLSCFTLHWFRDDYQWKGKFYKVHPVLLKFPLARKMCKSEGGRLATLETEEKFQEVTKLVADSKLEEGYWIGLQRNGSGQPPMWQYINGAKEASSNHMKDDGSRNCFSLYHPSSQEWVFQDTNCGNNQSFVCERNF